MPTPVTQSDYEALAAFRRALSRFLHFSATAARSVGLSPQQHQALLALKASPAEAPLSVTELAERLQLRHHSAVGLVDRLAAKNLVLRNQGRADRRVVNLSVSPKGEQLIARLSAAHRDELLRTGPELHARLQAILGPRRQKGQRKAPVG